MVISSYALGMRGTLLQVAIMQVHSNINETHYYLMLLIMYCLL
jgi:hypothetical protein